MSEILTDVGLNLPAQYTEDEFFEAGKFLARIEKGSQWAIGDWYNAIKWGDKEAACQRAGLNPTTAKIYGSVCTAFPIVYRIYNLTFHHYKSVIIQKLTKDQRQELLEKAEKNGLTVAQMVKERDRLLGKPDPIPLLSFDSKVESLMKELPASTTKKMRTALDAVIGKLKSEYSSEVDHAAKERMKAERAKIHQIEQEARAEKERLKGLRMNLDGLMTEDEYRLIRGCLHPDRAPEDRRDQFSRAFNIFSRLEQSVNRDMPAELRRERGWS